MALLLPGFIQCGGTEPRSRSDQIKALQSRHEARMYISNDKWPSCRLTARPSQSTSAEDRSITYPQPPCVSKHAGSSTGLSAEEEPRGRHPSSQFNLLPSLEPPFFLLLRTSVSGSDSRLLQLLVANDGTPRIPQTTTGRVCKYPETTVSTFIPGNYGIYICFLLAQLPWGSGATVPGLCQS